MSLPPSLLLLLAAMLPASIASPIVPEKYLLVRRSPSPQKIGIGFAIAAAVLIFAIAVFAVCAQHNRSCTCFRYRRRSPCASPNEKPHPIDIDALKSRISSPIQMHSSALPELSPLATQPHFKELPTLLQEKPYSLDLSAASEKALGETGLASPRKPPSVASVDSKSLYSSRKSSVATSYRKSMASVKTTAKSVYSTHERPPNVNSWFDRQSWFCRGAMEVEDEEKKIRGRGGVDMRDCNALAPPPPAVLAADVGDADARQSAMDWSGMEWLTKVYNGRKSRRLSGMRSFFIAGDEK